MSTRTLVVLLSLIWLPAFAQEEAKLYKPVDIGRHVDRGKVALQKITPERALELFGANNRIGECQITDAGKTLFEPAVQKLTRSAKAWWGKEKKRDRSFRKSQGPLEVIVRAFSSDEVHIWVLWQKGRSRWHSFFDLVAEFQVKRSGPVDGLFLLDQLEKRYSFTYKGVGHGTTAEGLVTKLGREYKEYPGQSPSYRNLYFPGHNLHVVIQEGLVMYVEQELPGWVDPKDAGPPARATLSQEDIRRVVRAKHKDLFPCYQKHHPDMSGWLNIEWVINSSGQVIQTSVKRNTSKKKDLAECAMRVIKRWQFPKPPDGKDVTIMFPFHFDTAGD